MHVENLAVFDTTYESEVLRAVLTTAETHVQSNLSQVAAVGAICNSATFDTSTIVNPDERKIAGNSIVGNATGTSFGCYIFGYVSSCVVARCCHPSFLGQHFFG
jgi:hypothetical protein